MPVTKKFNNIFICVSLLSTCVIFPACNRASPPSNEDKVIAYVNKEPIFASDVKRGMALKAKQDPLMVSGPDTEQGQLDIIVDRKLIIQEALRQGLARQDSFVQGIKSYWEQNLIKEFLDFKRKEFQNYLFVTENEVKKYYDNLGKRVIFKVLKSRDKQLIDDTYGDSKQNIAVDVESWDTVGPVGYEDITSSVLYDAFDLPPGQMKIAEDAPYYYLVTIVGKLDVPVKPLEELRPEIEKQVLAAKEQRLFDEWLKYERAGAKIEVKN